MSRCLRVRIPCRIFKHGRLKLSDVENHSKFRTFDPTVKIREGEREISGSIVEAIPTTEPPEYIWWPPTERDKRKEIKERKESW